jgi:hypothetical protein
MAGTSPAMTNELRAVGSIQWRDLWHRSRISRRTCEFWIATATAQRMKDVFMLVQLQMEGYLLPKKPQAEFYSDQANLPVTRTMTSTISNIERTGMEG